MNQFLIIFIFEGGIHKSRETNHHHQSSIRHSQVQLNVLLNVLADYASLSPKETEDFFICFNLVLHLGSF